MSVCSSVCLSNFLKGRNLHFQAPIGELLLPTDDFSNRWRSLFWFDPWTAWVDHFTIPRKGCSIAEGFHLLKDMDFRHISNINEKNVAYSNTVHRCTRSVDVNAAPRPWVHTFLFFRDIPIDPRKKIICKAWSSEGIELIQEPFSSLGGEFSEHNSPWIHYQSQNRPNFSYLCRKKTSTPLGSWKCYFPTF